MRPETHDITIVGSGLLGSAHLSREAEDVVRGARVVFYSAYNGGIADRVRALSATAEIRCSEEGEYRVGMHRPEMYARMAAAVVDAARAGPGVVMLAPGSAVVVDAVTQHVLERAREVGRSVRIVPGISSIESVLAELGYDASAGLTVVLAQKLVLQRIELDPRIASIVLQPAYFDTLFHAGAPRSREGRFDALVDQLVRTRSRDAPIALVITPTVVGDAASVIWIRLGALGALHRALSPRHTLFLPPDRDPEIDEGFAARIASWDACLAQVEQDERGAIVQQTRRAIGAADLDLPPDLAAESEQLAERWRTRPR